MNGIWPRVEAFGAATGRIRTMNDAATSALRISGLAFQYDGARSDARANGSAGPWMLRIPSLELQAGEQTLLTGGSGSGKSTLLHLIAGLRDPDAGVIAVAGQPIHALKGAARDLFRGRHIGMIFQTFNLLHGFSALENVMVALMFSDIPPKEHTRRASEALERLGIQRTGAMPEELSVGQQQRVAVARAVVCDPALVLADEPTASLDPENANAAMDLIQSACRERNAALLCVSHDPALQARFPRRVSISESAAQSSSTLAHTSADA